MIKIIYHGSKLYINDQNYISRIKIKYQGLKLYIND